jgi:16S rRNA (adenine1518-N6/adenine1519-N6)-dimethyltransferase
MVTPRVRARKSLGQHWLADSRYLSRIVAAAEISEADTVVEVGAGTGLLTERLAERAVRLIAVELDGRLAEALRQKFAGRSHVTVIEADVLETAVEQMLAAGGGGLPYVVVGNLPYYIGTAIVRNFIRDRLPPRRMVVTLQAEVARNMAAEPGHMSYLSVETQVFASALVLCRIPPRAFRPPPKVDSAIVRLDLHEGPDVEVDDMEAFLALARAGFAAPRKRLRNSLAIGLRIGPLAAEATIARAGLDPARRPAELSLADWRALYFAHRVAPAASP